MDHPFWRDVLAFPDRGVTSVIADAPDWSVEKQQRFLTLVVSGFYPISYCSALAFLRVADLSQDAETQRIAQLIGEIELGKHPLVPGAKHTDVRHCDQLKHLIASLLDGFVIDLPSPAQFPVVVATDFDTLTLPEALAICEVIETTAPSVIHHYADFVAAWQGTFRRPTRLLDRAYLDEHNLTEGESTEEQHICMLGRMMAPYAAECTSVAYADAQALFHARCTQHLEEVYANIATLIA